ncbi:MAG: YraN family protein [Pseudomonadota bacterium]
MANANQQIGYKFEDLGAQHLVDHGYKILAKNYRCRYGEIDIIAQNKNTLVFVEVKFRSQQDFGNALQMVTPSKQRKIIHTAQHYLQKNRRLNYLDGRFDVVGITQKDADESLEIEWIQGAFTI